MKVKELIDKLSKIDSEAEVFIENDRGENVKANDIEGESTFYCYNTAWGNFRWIRRKIDGQEVISELKGIKIVEY